jgi:hypothetical protein
VAFLLHLIDSRDVATPETAESFVAAEQDKPPGARRKFSAFKKAVVQTYPDVSKKDVAGEDDRNVWEEGLSVSAASGKVWPLDRRVHRRQPAVRGDRLRAHRKRP